VRFTYRMTTTTKTDAPRPGRVAATIDHDGRRLGHVICKGVTFTAVRKTGTDADMRKVGNGFRSIDAAAAWVAKTA
jgi:hypothetical protein